MRCGLSAASAHLSMDLFGGLAMMADKSFTMNLKYVAWASECRLEIEKRGHDS